MMLLLRDIFLVAGYELARAARTRLLQVVVLGYAVVVFLADWSFVEALSIAEAQVANTLGLPSTDRPGTLLAHVTNSEMIRPMLVDAIGSESLAAQLFDMPLLGVWAGVISMTALPVVMLAGTAGSLSGEVQSKSIRFLVLRTERLAIVFGKFLGQIGLVAIAGLVGTLVTLGVGQFMMMEQSLPRIATTVLRLLIPGLLFALPFGAMGLCASQWVGNRNGARALAVAALIANGILVAYAEDSSGGDIGQRIATIAAWFSPSSGWTALWEPSLLPAASRAGIVSLVWVALGFVRFTRRDL
jgi:hypothetical protein